MSETMCNPCYVTIHIMLHLEHNQPVRWDCRYTYSPALRERLEAQEKRGK